MAYNSVRTKEIHRLLNRTIITPAQLFAWTEDPDSNALWELLRPLANYMKSHRPTNLYRLRNGSPESIEAFSKDQVYLSRADYFNDPYDCMLYFDEEGILEHVRAELCETNLRECVSHLNDMLVVGESLDLPENWLSILLPKRDAFMEEVARIIPSVNINLQENMEIACFTENIASPIMWSHYADTHQGFALAYQFRSDMFCPRPYRVPDVEYDWYGWRSLLPVLYSDQRKDGSALANWYSLCKMMNQLGISAGPENDLSILLPDSLLKTKLGLHKATAWQYEAEWRMIFSREWPNRLEKHSAHIEYPASAVYLGCRIKEDIKKQIIGIAREKGIPAFQMYIDYSSKEYKLSYRPV